MRLIVKLDVELKNVFSLHVIPAVFSPLFGT